MLLNSRGHMCCLGFVGEQCGITKDEMLGRALPSSITEPEIRSKYPSWLLGENEMYCANFNDSSVISDDEREAGLIEIFNHQGDELEFVG